MNIIKFEKDLLDFVFSTKIFDLSLSDENDLLKLRTCKSFPQRKLNKIK
jgi:hypothetical protein